MGRDVRGEREEEAEIFLGSRDTSCSPNLSLFPSLYVYTSDICRGCHRQMSEENNLNRALEDREIRVAKVPAPWADATMPHFIVYCSIMCSKYFRDGLT